MRTYYPDRDGSIDALDRRETKTSQLIANHFQAATIIKAFNAILENDLLDPVALPNRAKCALPIGGDDAANKVIVTTLQADFGFDTVDVGPSLIAGVLSGPSPLTASRSIRTVSLRHSLRRNGIRNSQRGRGGDSPTRGGSTKRPPLEFATFGVKMLGALIVRYGRNWTLLELISL